MSCLSSETAQKKGIFLMGCAIKETIFFYFFIFKYVADEKLNIFCLRRHIQIRILVYTPL